AFHAASTLPRPPGLSGSGGPLNLDATVLRESFALVAQRSPGLAARFYEVLFARFPEAKSLFVRNHPREEEKMLYDALTAIVDRAEDVPWLRQNLRALGARHHAYGVTEEMYSWVGSSLLATLAEVAGERWSERMQRVWLDAYAGISALMLE